MNSDVSLVMFHKPILSAVVLAFSPVIFAAEEPADLAKLREAYQKGLTEAAVPVNARYAERLQAILKACTQRGDLDGALQVSKELEALKAGAALSPFRAALSGATFTWSHSNSGVSEVTFLPDGTLKTPSWGGRFTWKVVSQDTVSLQSEQFGSAKLTFNAKVTSYEGEDFRTKALLKGERVDTGEKATPSGGASGGSAFGRTTR